MTLLKRIGFCLLALVMLAFVGCGPTNPGTPTDDDDEYIPDRLLPFQVYNLNTYVKPLWEGTNVYNETVMFLGPNDTARLVYDIEEVVAVHSYGLDKLYVEDVDYVIEGNYIRRTPNSSIPYMAIDAYYPSDVSQGNVYHCTDGVHPYILKGEGDTFTRYQVAVTYRHSQKWDGYVPVDESAKLPKTMAKLNAKEGINVLFFGDSITTGCNSSSMFEIAPNADIWPMMVTKAIQTKYGYERLAEYTDNVKPVTTDNINKWTITKETNKINYINTAVGGQNSIWANNEYENRIVNLNPDLIFIAFGVNDVSRNELWYNTQMTQLVNNLQLSLPNAEIVLVSPIYPNKDVKNKSQTPPYDATQAFLQHQDKFEGELVKIANSEQGVVVARVTSVYNRALQNKRYRDMTGNNINHPNDFGARIYAQAIIAALGIRL